MEVYKFDKTTEWFLRATKVVPGGIYGNKGPAMVVPGYFPLYAVRGEGCHYWDVDGNEYIDYMCGFGPNVLGYLNPAMEAALTEARKRADGFNHPTTDMVELAEYMTGLITGMQWAVFGKNGSDMTTLSLLVAREHTHKKKILRCKHAYHGSYSWSSPGHGGIIEEDTCNIHLFEWNDFKGFTDLVERYQGEIAAVIMTPYHHPAFDDSAMPAPGWWDKVCAVARDQGFLVISDDIRAGFRVDYKGTHNHFGFQPDMACYCKAMANGYPIAALLGTQEVMDAASSVFCTGTFWTNGMPMRMAIACMEELRRIDAIKIMNERGTQLIEGLHRVAADHGQALKITGPPAIPFVRFANEIDFFRNQRFCSEATRRGAYLHPHHNWFLTAAHTEEDINRTLEIADVAMGIVEKEFGRA